MRQSFTLADIEHELNISESLSTLPTFKVHVLRNVTVEAFVPYIRYELMQLGLNARVEMGEYGQIVSEALAPAGIPGSVQDSDCVFVFMSLKSMAPTLWDEFARFSAEEIRSELGFIKEQIRATVEGVRAKTKGLICWNSFELPVFPSLGVLEDQGQTGLSAAIAELNEFVRSMVEAAGNAYLIDLDRLLRTLGVAQFYDKKLWHMAKSLYSRRAQQLIAGESAKVIRACTGRAKKVLILDCDNTLWGGVIGEDGMQGIRLGTSFPGCWFKDFQKAALALHHRGVVLAICSKNNEEDVWAVFDQHPDMVLRQENIAVATINWDDKATNIRRISAQLNLGTDSFVFVDDSEFEANLIRQSLPEVETICLAGKTPAELAELLHSCGLFDQLTTSQEDKNRGRLYKEEAQRNQLKEGSLSLDDYLKSLEMILEVKRADASFVQRISQLTQRTNQFNLTTKRYSESEIKEFVESKDNVVFVASLKDRFGDAGIVGTCIISMESSEQAVVDTFLLSCRVLGRGIEAATLATILSFCWNQKVSEVTASYQETKKNGQVRDFYPSQAFELTQHKAEEKIWVYRRRLDETTEISRFHGLIHTQF